jgi:hypothetical protein
MRGLMNHSTWIETERRQIRDYLAEYLAYDIEPDYERADAFILAMHREGWAIVPRRLVDNLYGV